MAAHRGQDAGGLQDGARDDREDQDAVVTALPGAQKPEPAAVSVTAYPDGPLVVRGPVQVQGEDGQPVGRPRASVALCRCGLSGRAPLCDGSHQVAARVRRSRRS